MLERLAIGKMETCLGTRLVLEESGEWRERDRGESKQYEPYKQVKSKLLYRTFCIPVSNHQDYSMHFIFLTTSQPCPNMYI